MSLQPAVPWMSGTVGVRTSTWFPTYVHTRWILYYAYVYVRDSGDEPISCYGPLTFLNEHEFNN